MINLVAQGSIKPCRFVKFGSSSNTGLQAGAGDTCVGISRAFTRSVSLQGVITLTEDNICVAGEPVPMADINHEALLELGGTVAAGDRLKPDAQGRGVTAAATDNAYAIAMQSGASGHFIRVKVIYDNV